ncbi:tetratricopeptide repeat protein [Roseospira visakhapatnamensis]|uniref:Tetratricopeptide (TPR) repeat protein n=1 Tax=Roseospira visakhapatnamensis TaxID=390880 RepID=A0A7W6RE53_9PROT|nr:tetratricopeptide repeat protein [Roseospira visakhapatnamensis]MBB4266248.1 tetratricopeptide (TPR) repeat protein [Roseospira visakhapatnamensis]
MMGMDKEADDGGAAAARTAFAHALHAWRDGDLQTAAALCRDLSRADPLNADAWTLLARVALAWRRPREALELCGRALVADPAHPEALVALGAVLGAMAALDPALIAARRATHARPDGPEGWHQRAEVARLAGLGDESVAAARRVVALRPDAVTAWSGLGTALAEQGEVIAAGHALARACRLAPRDRTARARLRALVEMRRAQGEVAPAADR